MNAPLILAILFLLAALAPRLWRRTPRLTVWLAAGIPGGVAIYFVSLIPGLVQPNGLVSTFEWLPELGVSFSFVLDGLSLLFAMLVAGIGAIVLSYAASYLEHRSETGRFYAWMLAFLASMLGLVLSGNLLLLYIFWELTTVSSFVLIGFEHDREDARRAAMQALIVTFSGGLSLLAGLILLSTIAGTLQIPELIAQAETIRADARYPAVLALIVIGAFAKSAQYPLHFWLPTAMAAPTPVSAYLHSAAMVKAGVFLLARMVLVLGDTDLWFAALTIGGGVSGLLGAWQALVQTDLKRVLAYSTIAALGLLVLLLGIGTEEALTAAMYYIIAHACYKSALFLMTGSVDRETGTREIPELSGLRRQMPRTAVIGILAGASMAGIPLTAGFVGKEHALESALHFPFRSALLVACIAAIGTMFVALAGQAGLRAFTGVAARDSRPAHDPPRAMWGGPLLLAVIGVVTGLAPFALREPVSRAVAAIRAEPVTLPSASALPPVSLALLISVATIALGAALYFIYPRLQRIASASLPERLTPSGWYSASIHALERLARITDDILLTGQLKHYLLTVTAMTALLLGSAFARYGPNLDAAGLGNFGFSEILLIGAILGSAAAVTVARTAMAAVTALGTVGYSIALLFALHGAPDLAMTQLIAETLTVIIFALALYHLPSFSTLTKPGARTRDAVLAIGSGVLIAAMVVIARPLTLGERISGYYMETAVPEAHAHNVVNAIITDYRALDTMGEVTVLTMAGAGVYSLLRLRIRRGRRT